MCLNSRHSEHDGSFFCLFVLEGGGLSSVCFFLVNRQQAEEERRCGTGQRPWRDSIALWVKGVKKERGKRRGEGRGRRRGDIKTKQKKNLNQTTYKTIGMHINENSPLGYVELVRKQ